MKNLVVLFGLMTFGTVGFSQYNDTLYFKSGNVKSCTIVEYDDEFIVYNYRNKKQKLVDNKIAISSLKSFVIYNEFNELIFDSKNPAKKEGE